MLNSMIRKALIAKACNVVTNADLAHKYPVGTTFSFDILGAKEAASARLVIEKVLDKAGHLSLSKVAQYGPYKVVYVAKGAPCDLICQDADGDHFYIPSGVLHMVKKCEEGVFPPPFPADEVEDNAQESPEEIVKELLDSLRRKAA